MEFKKAVRKNVKLKLAVTGPSGSGKTFSALRLAKGMLGKVAVIDSENGSASLYSDKFDFDVIEVTPPFTVEKYVAAVNEAEKQKYDVIVIDTITQVWAGEGGLLQQKEMLDMRPGSNSYTNWANVTKKHEIFKSAILNSPCHVVCTMRSKQDYILVANDKNKLEPKKIGLAPIQRDGLEYDFTIVFDIAMDHNAATSKDRTGLFTDQVFQVTEEVGNKIKTWLESGAIDLSKNKKPDEIKQEKCLVGSASPEQPKSNNNIINDLKNKYCPLDKDVTAPLSNFILCPDGKGFGKKFTTVHPKLNQVTAWDIFNQEWTDDKGVLRIGKQELSNYLDFVEANPKMKACSGPQLDMLIKFLDEVYPKDTPVLEGSIAKEDEEWGDPELEGF